METLKCVLYPNFKTFLVLNLPFFLSIFLFLPSFLPSFVCLFLGCLFGHFAWTKCMLVTMLFQQVLTLSIDIILFQILYIWTWILCNAEIWRFHCLLVINWTHQATDKDSKLRFDALHTQWPAITLEASNLFPFCMKEGQIWDPEACPSLCTTRCHYTIRLYVSKSRLYLHFRSVLCWHISPAIYYSSAERDDLWEVKWKERIF